MSAAVSLRERLKQYQGLKENTQKASYVPPSRQQELDLIAKKSPMRTSLRKIETGKDEEPPKAPGLDAVPASPEAKLEGMCCCALFPTDLNIAS